METDKPIELTLEEEDAVLARGAHRPLAAGAYNPYDVDPRRGHTHDPTAPAASQKTDLRKLSEWIKLKREIEELKAQETQAAKTASK